MSARLTLVAHASTAATTRAAFPLDEGLELRGRAAARAARWRFRGRVTRASCSPATAARETAEALGLETTTDSRLADWDLGAWRGFALDEIAAGVPGVRSGTAAVTAWLAGPAAAPHGGERLTALLERVAAWLAEAEEEGHTVAVTHVAVVRAAVVSALSAPPSAFWRLDVGPLTATDLRGGPGRWTVRGTALPLDPARR